LPDSVTTSGYSVADLARRWRIGRDKVRGFIRRGEIVAVNFSTVLSGKPQWRVMPEEASRFEQRRSSAAPVKTAPRRRQPAGATDFYP